MAYKPNKYHRTRLQGVETTQGEPIEWKIARVVDNKEPITDGAPEIFTERSEGVVSAYNIRTDRWEIAAEAMDAVSGTVEAKRDAKAEKRAKDKAAKKEAKVVKIDQPKSDGGAESTNGTTDTK